MNGMITINDDVVYGITAARLDFNASIPQTIPGPPAEDGTATTVPNPDLIASDWDYFTSRASGMVASWANQHKASAPPVSVPPVVINLVPQSVDMVKVAVYFVRIGVADAVNDAIAAAGPEAQAIWARSKTVQRQNPLVLQIAHDVLHWTDAEIDNHFVQADKVVV